MLTVALIDALEDFTSPRTAAINFMTTMARYRQNAFMQVLASSNSVLQKYNDSPVEARNPREKDGALVMIGALAPLILRKVKRDYSRAHFVVRITKYVEMSCHLNLVGALPP